MHWQAQFPGSESLHKRWRSQFKFAAASSASLWLALGQNGAQASRATA